MPRFPRGRHGTAFGLLLAGSVALIGAQQLLGVDAPNVCQVIRHLRVTQIQAVLHPHLCLPYVEDHLPDPAAVLLPDHQAVHALTVDHVPVIVTLEFDVQMDSSSSSTTKSARRSCTFGNSTFRNSRTRIPPVN